MPEHVLEEQNRVVVAGVLALHGLARFYVVFHCLTHRLGAFLQPVFDTLSVTLGGPAISLFAEEWG
ncbi:hypothetical protein MGR01S_15050 [Meiothermus granaticius NBRC 107808]|nr:hypothetical protein MGR01S_15050 [Meiothermus granaticius NBRC 107808]